MDKKSYKIGIEDILDLTDTEESSSSSSQGLFDSQPFVLELHELKMDEPGPENVTTVTKVKKQKKKKRTQPTSNKSHSSVSSESVSEISSVTPTVDELPREEFYDAHESYHALAENQGLKPVSAAALVLAQSEHGQEPKAIQGQTSQPPSSATARDPSSTISKPVTPPE